MKVIVTLIGLVSFTPTPVPHDDAKPDAKQLLLQSAIACKKVQTIEYHEQHVAGSADAKPTLTATVRQARAIGKEAGPVSGKYLISGEVQQQKGISKEFAFSYDGSTLRCLEPREKVVHVVKNPNSKVAARVFAMAGVPMIGSGFFTQEQPYSQQLEKGVKFEHLGFREILGVNCHVVQIDWVFENEVIGKKTLTTILYLGKDDLLPRGNEFKKNYTFLKIEKVNDSKFVNEFSVPVKAGYVETTVTGTEAQKADLLQIGTAAPNWELKDSQGKTHALKDYRGKIVILDFWGTWCVPCRMGMPAIQSLHEQFKDRGVEIFGIAVHDEEGNPAGYMKRMKFTYGLLLKGDSIAAAYKAMMLPTLYVIGPDGKILHCETGFRESAKTDLTKLLERELARLKK